MKVRKTVDNPDSQFVAMPQTITPAGIELNPQTEPIQEPNPNVETTIDINNNQVSEQMGNNNNITDNSDENKY